MMTEEQRAEQIESFLNGNMTNEERDLFESELAQNQNLNKELEMHRKAEEAIAYLNRRELKQKLELIDSEEPSISKQPRIRKLIVKWAAAASIVILAGFGIVFTSGYFNQNSSLSDLSDEFFAPTTAESFRGTETQLANSYEEQLMAADVFYKSGEYELAIIEYKRLSRLDNVQSERAEWNLVMSYLLSESHQSECDKLLDQIASDKTHPYHDWAVKLQKDIRD